MTALVHAETRVEGDTPPQRSIVVCGTQRVGTTLLCDLMTTSGRLGYPKEFFLPKARQAFLRGWGLPADTVDEVLLHHVLRNGTSPNGVFATKLMADQLGPFDQMTGGAGLSALPSPTLVWLRRRDLLATAVSQWIAEMTGRWSTVSEQPPPPIDPRTADMVRIDTLHRAKHEQEARWVDRLTGHPVLEAWYEDWTARPTELLAQVAAAAGVDVAGTSPTSGLRRQSGPANAAIAARWQAEFGPCQRCDRPR